MPVQQGAIPSSGFANTNGTLRKEIRDDLMDAITDIDALKRTADSIATSDNFHLDSRMESGQWKVDVQHKRGAKKPTVAQIMLHPDASTLADAITGITNSAQDGHIWIVT